MAEINLYDKYEDIMGVAQSQNLDVRSICASIGDFAPDSEMSSLNLKFYGIEITSTPSSYLCYEVGLSHASTVDVLTTPINQAWSVYSTTSSWLVASKIGDTVSVYPQSDNCSASGRGAYVVVRLGTTSKYACFGVSQAGNAPVVWDTLPFQCGPI